jgi:hypothetical protein
MSDDALSFASARAANTYTFTTLFWSSLVFRANFHQFTYHVLNILCHLNPSINSELVDELLRYVEAIV